MAVTCVMPGALREFCGGRAEVRLMEDARTVQEALDGLWRECPGARDRVLDDRGRLRVHVNVFADGVNIKFMDGFGTALREGSELVILPAISGG